MTKSKRLLNADPIRTDFRNFLYIVWKHLDLPQPTPIQYDMGHYLQHGPSRMIVEAFRGVGKSWITVAFSCWLLLNNPQLNILVVSKSRIHADNFTTFMLQLIMELPILQHLMPRDGQRNSKIAFDVNGALSDLAPSVKSVGITGQITGSRADVVIPDDIETPDNSATVEMRIKLFEIVKEFDAVVKPNGRIIYLGTPQTEDSLYNRIQKSGIYVARKWPVTYPEDMSKYSDLSPMIAEHPELKGKPTEPTRFGPEVIIQKMGIFGNHGFALQYMLDTRLSDADQYPLKLSDLAVMALNPESAPEKVIWASGPQQVISDLPCIGLDRDKYHRPLHIQGNWIPYQGKVMFIDPSGKGTDETAYAVVGMLNSQLFLLDAGGFKAGFTEDTLKALAMIAAKNKVQKILIEENYGGGMFAQLLKPITFKIYPVTIEETRSSKQKERRICDTLEPVLNTHKLMVDETLIRQDFQRDNSEHGIPYQLFYQMSRITRDRGALIHDDRLDALAGAVAYWTELMATSTDDQIAARQQELERDEYDNFMAHAIGHKPPRPTWHKIA